MYHMVVRGLDQVIEEERKKFDAVERSRMEIGWRDNQAFAIRTG